MTFTILVPALAISSGAFLDNVFETWPSPPPPSGGGTDMSSYFKTLKTCTACIGAGYGWCPVRRMCGGFANKECGIGPNYVVEGYKASPTSSGPSKKKKASMPASSSSKGNVNDMSSTFAKLRDCSSCVDAGYGWCPLQRKCGGFANKECGIGERYVAPGKAPPQAKNGAPRNGLWESKKARAQREAAESPPAADVPKASPPPPASLLYAGPVSPPPSASVTVSPTGASSASTVTSTMPSSNETRTVVAAVAEASMEEKEALMRLPHNILVAKVLQLQATLAAMKVA